MCFALDDGRAERCRYRGEVEEEKRMTPFAKGDVFIFILNTYILNHKLRSMFWTLFNLVKDEQKF